MPHRFLIHPGYPKCGSTSLQANVFAQHPGLKYLSNHSAPGDAFRDAPETEEFHRLLRTRPKDSLPGIEVLWQEHIRPAADPARLNVISDETFLNNEASAEEIAGALRHLLGPARVLIVVREQVDILRSMYDMYPWLKDDPDRRFLHFPQWLEQTLESAASNTASALRFVQMVGMYRDLFGSEAVTVIAFDRLFRDRTAQVALCARLAIDAGAFSTLIALKAANTSADHGTKKLVRRVLGPVKGSSFLSPAQIRVLRGLLARLIPQKPTQVDSAERARIEAFYRGQRIADLPTLGTEGMIL